MDRYKVTAAGLEEAEQMLRTIKRARELLGVERLTTREQVDEAVRLMTGGERPHTDWLPDAIAAEAEAEAAKVRAAAKRARRAARHAR